MAARIAVRRLGRVEYDDGLALMRAVASAREQGELYDTLLLLEHPPVLTLGRGADLANVLLPRGELARRGVELFETDRGGDVTYHGPGQLVAYPVFDLRPDRQDVRRYVRDLEECIIRTLGAHGIAAGRIPKWTGVWVGAEDDPAAAKIAAIGVHLRKWVTTHGLALNVAPDLSHFRLIVPCGIRERGVTSMERQLGRSLTLDEVGTTLARTFGEVFGREVEELPLDGETISVAVVRPGAAGPEVLVLTRIEARGGFPQIVTGRIEEGEAPAAAAARELVEETGLALPVSDLRYVHAFGWGAAPRFLREHAFAAVAPAGAAVRTDPAEHSDAAWMPLAAAREAMPFAGLRRAVDAAVALLDAR